MAVQQERVKRMSIRIESRAPVAGWLSVVLLSAIAGGLAATLLRQAPAAAQTGPAVPAAVPAAAASGPAAQAGNIVAVAGQLTPNNYGLYLIDLQTGTICVYQFVTTERNEKQLRLAAARTFLFDRQLEEYNTEPSPATIADRVKAAKRLKDVKEE
jgi:hypothetical protein